MPHAADVGAFLQDREIVETRALQRHCGCDAGDSGADDDDSWLALRSKRSHGGEFTGVVDRQARNRELAQLARARRRPWPALLDIWHAG